MPAFRSGKKSSLIVRTDSVLTPILKNLGIEAGVRLAQIKNNWQNIFDRPLSLHMYPSKLSAGELLLNVDSPIWIQQLTYYKKEIIEKLHSYGVKEVRFRIGRISPDKQIVPKSPVLRELSDEDKLFISDLTSEIKDEDLKGAVKTAVERSLKAKPQKKKTDS